MDMSNKPQRLSIAQIVLDDENDFITEEQRRQMEQMALSRSQASSAQNLSCMSAPAVGPYNMGLGLSALLILPSISTNETVMNTPEAVLSGEQKYESCLKRPQVLHSYAAIFILFILLWGTFWGLVGEPALPSGPIFALLVVIFCSYIGGQIVVLIKCPPLLGMLLVGFGLRNIPGINIGENLDPLMSSSFRNTALVVILLRAGLGLDPDVLRKLSFVCCRLAFFPCLVETLTIGIMGHLILDLPWLWSFMLGFVLGAVSPAVVVPFMLSLEEKGLGINKGIPTLVIAAASVDDVLAITGFGILLGITFSEGNMTWTILKGPVEALIGIVFGTLLGGICWYFPNSKSTNAGLFRAALLTFGGLFAMFVSQQAEIAGAGALGCLSFAFVAALKWRREEDWSKTEAADNIIVQALNILWLLLQPALFGLIGAELKLSQMETETVVLGLACLSIGLAMRILASFTAVLGGGFSFKECIFISLAWIPKATVQAAIGSVALDLARDMARRSETENKNNEQINLGITVLTVAVLSILTTAPLGALAIALSAPKLLTQTPKTLPS